MNNLLFELLSQNFLMVNKTILRQLGPDATCILSLLIDKYRYWHMAGQLKADGSFYKTSEEFYEELGLTRKMFEKGRKTLVEMELICTFSERNPVNPMLSVTRYLLNGPKIEQLFGAHEMYPEDITRCTQGTSTKIPSTKKEEEREKSFFQEDEKGAKQPKSSSWEKELSRTTSKSIPETRKQTITPKFNNGAGVSQDLTPPAAYNKNYEEDTIAIQKTYDHWGLTKENPWLEFDENGKPKKRSKV